MTNRQTDTIMRVIRGLKALEDGIYKTKDIPIVAGNLADNLIQLLPYEDRDLDF